ncbi:hypothetical protein SPI_05234 [Niveomyces insectorum RCEF 264]|uniref:Uncharacterized protein n=1 Tax=Niveomyces insectorum RCEF 264 TaxID=1081102 RepID=A0A167U3H9_9HYPO|nr:hypothetical protein SPI_05234 [Niveomyces insectorum RCEF 264]
MAFKPPHPRTLFHLVPTNDAARNALSHPDNARFVSRSPVVAPGLEVGFHVPSTSQGHVVTRLGRNADLILCQASDNEPMSAVHVAFQINPITKFVVLSIRSKRTGSVKYRALGGAIAKFGQAVEMNSEDGVIPPGVSHEISIAACTFNLHWISAAIESIQSLVQREYRASMEQAQGLRTRDRPTQVDDSAAQTWQMTWLNPA